MLRRSVAALAVLGAAFACSSVRAGTSVPPLPSNAQVRATQQKDLQLAEDGLAAARKLWWDKSRGWYDEYRFSDYSMPLLMLWSAYQVFNAVNGVALADPTPANVRAVRAFANGAESYWNPKVKPVGAYAYYPNFTNTHIRYYFDDNGWFGLAFLDAYEVTDDRRYLNDALKAFRFLAVAGWDDKDGGFWWETKHDHKTSEPLAAGILMGARLYGYTRNRTYLLDAVRWLKWADAHSWNTAKGLYQRSATDDIVMSYVEGLMAAANEEVCKATGVSAHCARAELVARNSLDAFGTDLSWNPRYDAVYLYGLLHLYERDHNPTWFALAYHNAQRALATQDANGFFLRGWDGSTKGDDTTKAGLGLDAATLSVFAWLAAETPPP